MKKLSILVCITLLTFSSTSLRAQSDQKEQLTVPLSNPGKPYSLEVSLVTGSIDVTSYSGKEIIIEVTPVESRRRNKGSQDTAYEMGGKKIIISYNSGEGRRKNTRSQDTVDGMRRITPKNSYEITATEKDNNVSVNNNGLERNIHLSLKIPQDVKLKLHTVNDGNIVVDNIKGELEITDVNGGIKMTNISGSVVANTVNGNVTATFLSIDPQAPMAFSTLNGNVDISLPAGTKSNLKLRSDRGDIFTDFDVAIDKNEPKLDRNPESGLYVLKMGDWVNGKINGGGAEILMKNMNGNIYVRKAK